MGRVGNVVRIFIEGDAKDLGRAVKEASGDLEKLEKKASGSAGGLKKLGLLAGAGVAAGIGAAAAAIAVCVDAGDKLNESQEQLAQTAKNLHLNEKQLADTVKAAVPHFEKYGITQAQLTDAVNKFVTIGDKPAKAMLDSQHAADLAAHAHISYEDAVKAVTQADLGKYRGIQKLLGPIKNQNDLTKAYTKIQGDANIASHSLAGQQAELRAKFKDLTAHIGQALIPILVKLIGWILKTLIPALSKAATWIRTVMIPAIVAFGQRMVQLYNQWVKPIVTQIVNQIRGLATFLDGIFKLIRDIVTGHWGRLWGDVEQILRGAWTTVKGMFGQLWQELLAIIEGVGPLLIRAAEGIGSGIMNAIKGAVKGGVNLIVDLINGLIDLVNGFQIHIKAHKIAGVTVLPGFDWGGLGIPHIPRLHSGGMFYSGRGEGLALLQDGERVLSRGEAAAYNDAPRQIVYQTVHAGNDPRTIAYKQAKWNRRNGVVPVTTP
jgi:hypothetical protein